MNITEALMNVKESAQAGRKLEAWCDANPDLSFRYDEGRNMFGVFGGLHPANGRIVQTWNHREVMGTWHVREVKK